MFKYTESQNCSVLEAETMKRDLIPVNIAIIAPIIIKITIKFSVKDIFISVVLSLILLVIGLKI